MVTFYQIIIIAGASLYPLSIGKIEDDMKSYSWYFKDAAFKHRMSVSKRCHEKWVQQARAYDTAWQQQQAAWYQQQKQWDAFFAKVEWDRAKDDGVSGVARYYVKRWKKAAALRSWSLTPAGRVAVGAAGGLVLFAIVWVTRRTLSRTRKRLASGA